MSAGGSFDAIVIGAGHNGLACAAALAQGGRRVLVAERGAWVGGLAAPVEIHKGYKTAGVLGDTSRVRPWVVDALGLARHGLRRRAEATPVLCAADGGRGPWLRRDGGGAGSELSAADAQGYAAWRAFVARIAGFARRLLDAPPPDLRASGLAAARALLGPALALRRLGRRTMHDVLRIAPMSAADWLGESFADERLQMLLTAPAVGGTWLGPRSAGSAALVLMHEAAREPEIEGGAPALVRALRSACEAGGVEILTDAAVRRITVADGAVSGVLLETGEELAAPQVASSVDPRHTLLDLVDPGDLPPELARELAAYRCRGTTAVVHLALDGPFEVAGRPGERVESLVVGEGMAALERAFDAVRYGEMSAAPVLEVRVPTASDPSLAPPGHEVASVLVHYVPHDLRAGWNEAARARVQELCLQRLAAVAPAVPDRIVALDVLTPVDLERRYGLAGGHVHHGEHALDQLFWLRPSARCARYATPIGGLFLCGSGSHPGGGLTGAPGALAAAAMLGRSR